MYIYIALWETQTFLPFKYLEVPWVPETFDGLGENLRGITFLKMTFSRKMMFES